MTKRTYWMLLALTAAFVVIAVPLWLRFGGELRNMVFAALKLVVTR